MTGEEFKCGGTAVKRWCCLLTSGQLREAGNLQSGGGAKKLTWSWFSVKAGPRATTGRAGDVHQKQLGFHRDAVWTQSTTSQRSSTFIQTVGSSLVSSSPWIVWFKLQVSLDGDLWNAYELFPSCGLFIKVSQRSSNIKCCLSKIKDVWFRIHMNSVVTGNAGAEDNWWR